MINVDGFEQNWLYLLCDVIYPPKTLLISTIAGEQDHHDRNDSDQLLIEIVFAKNQLDSRTPTLCPKGSIENVSEGATGFKPYRTSSFIKTTT